MQHPSQPLKIRRSAALIFSVILILSMAACNFPFAKPTQPVEVQPTVTTQPTVAIKQDLPPIVIETSPYPLSTIPLTGGIQLTFSQAMERQSVEGALQIEPSMGGKFTWKDDRNVTFTPDQALPTAMRISLTLRDTARAANGKSLLEAQSFDFQTADALRLTQKLPEGNEIDPTSAIVAAFNQPVVALGADAASLPAAFTLEPAADGQGEWLNTSTYIFYPEPALLGGQQYIVQVDPGLLGTAGTTFAEDETLSWAFVTTFPRILDVRPTVDPQIRLDANFVIRFNQPMDQAVTEDAFSFTGNGGERVPGSFEWNETGTELTFDPTDLLTRNTAHYLYFDQSAAGLGGTPLLNPQQYSFFTVPELQLIEPDTSLLETYSGYGSFSLQFTAPLKPKQSFSEIVTISPPIDGMDINVYDSNMYVSGYFQPSTTYTLQISTALVDAWDGALVAPVTYNFNVAPFPSAVVIPMVRAGGRVLTITPWETRIQAEVNNISRIDASSKSVSFADFAALQNDFIGFDMMDMDTFWNQSITGDLNKIQKVGLKLSPGGGPLNTGIYAYYLNAPEIDEIYYRAGFFAVISRVQLTMKVSQQQVMVWAVNLENQTPIADMPVNIYDAWGESLGTAITDAEGVAVLQTDQPVDLYTTAYAMTGQPGDALFGLASTDMVYGISPWQAGVSADYDAEAMEAYLYTDRPIYRPGQTVYMRGILRYPQDGRYSLPSDAPMPITEVTLKLYGYASDGSETGWEQELVLPLSAYGSFDLAVELPAGLATGYYYAELPGIAYPNSVGFQVAEYRKPEIEVQVAFAQTDVLAGMPLELNASAEYYFGAAAANLPVNWSLYYLPDYFSLPGYRTGKTQWGRWWWDPTYITGGTGVTDGQGGFSVTIPEADYLASLDPEVLNRLTIEVTVADESGLPVSARADVLRHPAGFYIGVRADSWNATSGKEIGFDVLTVDWLKKSSGNHTLQANFSTVEWVEDGINPSSGDAEYRRETSLVASTDFSVDASGKARLAFTPPSPGVYLLDVRGEGTVTEYTLWVTGSGVSNWPRLPDDRLELQADADLYQVGDAAQINIPNPLNREALALITVERNRVMRSEVISIPVGATAYSLPILAEDAPNIYVTVLLLSSQTGGLPVFRYGILNLNVDPEQLILQVALKPQPEQGSPGDEVSYLLEVKDSAGKPVQAEFSLAVVDKALLALADANTTPIEEAFYGKKSLGVLTSTSLAVYNQRIDHAVMVLGRGGGGGDAAAVAPTSLREDFRDTAFWQGSVETDAQGKAEVRMTLPDNLTTWVAEVRGVDKEMRVGSGTAEVVVSKDLLVRPVTPRFVAVSDHLELAAIVHNNTSEPLDGLASLQGSGFALDDPTAQSLPFSLAAGEHVRVSWWGTVESVDELDIVFSAEAGGLNDSTRPVWGKLPVLHYSSPQTFGTSGVMPQAGQRLEVVSLPTSFTPTGGSLEVELTPSLAAAILGDLDALDAYAYDYTETILSQLLPNIETYNLLKNAGIDAPELETRLTEAVADGLERLERMQNSDGGWGWGKDDPSQVWLSAYVVFGLSRARQADWMVSNAVIEEGQRYLNENRKTPSDQISDGELNDAVFAVLALSESGAEVNPEEFWPFYERMSPAAKAMLALMMHRIAPGSENEQTLVTQLQGSAVRSASGAHWEEADAAGWTYQTANYSTAVVVYTIAQIDPASTLLPDAVRYLAAHRKVARNWGSSFETAWVLMAMGQYMQGTGDIRPLYDYSASLNGAQIANGSASGTETVTPVTTRIPIAELLADEPNGLLFERTTGNGTLFYRAYLRVDRPVEETTALDRGIGVERAYYLYAQDCRMPDCPQIDSTSLSAENPQVLVRLTLTLPHEMYYLVVEDFIPAGFEVVDLSLKTTQKGDEGISYEVENPFRFGWAWWWFRGPQIYDERVHWSAQYLQAGSYELTYRLMPVTAGEFQTLPARAWEYYFPEVEGSSAGSIFTVTP